MAALQLMSEFGMSGRLKACGAWTWAVGVAMLALAGTLWSAPAAADLELGRYLASECMTCHRPGAATAIPNIYGLAEPTFAEVMRGYRARRLANPVMQNIAGRLSDDDIAALALFFATTKK